MKIACLQYAPHPTDPASTIASIRTHISTLSDSLHLLVLPELSFTTTAFPTPSAAFQISQQQNEEISMFMISLAKNLDCPVVYGLPTSSVAPPVPVEKPKPVFRRPRYCKAKSSVDPLTMSLPVSPRRPATMPAPVTAPLASPRSTSESTTGESTAESIPDSLLKDPVPLKMYNSLAIMTPHTTAPLIYHTSKICPCDTSWAHSGETVKSWRGGWVNGLGKVSVGLTMDLNNTFFEKAPYDFAVTAQKLDANIVILSMAWPTPDTSTDYLSAPTNPDLHSLTQWLLRLRPLILSSESLWSPDVDTSTTDEVLLVIANRIGHIGDSPYNPVYAGTSAIIGISQGALRLYGLLGRGDEGILVADTSKPPMAHLRLDRFDDEEDWRQAQKSIFYSCYGDQTRRKGYFVKEVDGKLTAFREHNPSKKIRPNLTLRTNSATLGKDGKVVHLATPITMKHRYSFHNHHSRVNALPSVIEVPTPSSETVASGPPERKTLVMLPIHKVSEMATEATNRSDSPANKSMVDSMNNSSVHDSVKFLSRRGTPKRNPSISGSRRNKKASAVHIAVSPLIVSDITPLDTISQGRSRSRSCGPQRYVAMPPTERSRYTSSLTPEDSAPRYSYREGMYAGQPENNDIPPEIQDQVSNGSWILKKYLYGEKEGGGLEAAAREIERSESQKDFQ